MTIMGVKFISVKLKSTYLALENKDPSALYWISETAELFKGDQLFGTGALATEQAAGLLSPEDYAELKKLIAAGPASTLKPVDGSLVIADGKIGVNISKAANNLIAVNSDGLFAAIDLHPIEQRLTEVEKQVVGGIHYKGSVPTVEDLPTNPAQGDLYEVEANGSEYCWNGERWFQYGTSHFQPVTGAGIDINGSTISVKLSASNGNALVVAEDNGLFVPECKFTDKDRVVIDTLPMLYVTTDEMNNAISRAVENNVMMWEELGSNVGVAKIGNTYYSTIQQAIAAANAGDIVKIMAGDYGMIEFTDSTKSNITLLGEDGVRIKKIRLMDTANYGAPYGLTLKNITFNGEGIIANNDKINNLSVANCDFVNGAVIHIGSCITDGLIVEKCEFEATNSAINLKEKTAILVQGTSKNVVIRNNTIKDCEHNAIQVVGASGSMLIDSNTINNTGSRAMRITTKDGAVFAMMNNVITNANTNPAEAEENAGEIIKITGSVVDGAIANNIYNGNELVFNKGIGQVL
jgi:hypothetical protein